MDLVNTVTELLKQAEEVELTRNLMWKLRSRLNRTLDTFNINQSVDHIRLIIADISSTMKDFTDRCVSACVKEK